MSSYRANRAGGGNGPENMVCTASSRYSSRSSVGNCWRSVSSRSISSSGSRARWVEGVPLAVSSAGSFTGGHGAKGNEHVVTDPAQVGRRTVAVPDLLKPAAGRMLKRRACESARDHEAPQRLRAGRRAGPCICVSGLHWVHPSPHPPELPAAAGRSSCAPAVPRVVATRPAGRIPPGCYTRSLISGRTSLAKRRSWSWVCSSGPVWSSTRWRTPASKNARTLAATCSGVPSAA